MSYKALRTIVQQKKNRCYLSIYYCCYFYSNGFKKKNKYKSTLWNYLDIRMCIKKSLHGLEVMHTETPTQNIQRTEVLA